MVTVRFVRVSKFERMPWAKRCASKGETSNSQICHYVSVRSVKEMKDASGVTDGNCLT